MKRLIWFVVASVWLPLSAAAQGGPPVPPVPRVPAAPAVPRVPPVPPVPLEHHGFELMDLDDHLRQLKDFHLDADQFRLSADQQRKIAEQARLSADQVRLQFENLRNLNLDLTFEPFEFGQGRGPVVAISRDESGMYSSGLNAVTQRQYDRAITLFDRLLAQGSTRADGALYWKAFSQARLTRTDDALATLTTLRRDHPQSRYLTDANVLEADVRKLAGQRVDPQTLDANDEMKLLAINGIANTEPGVAIPLLEGVLRATNTLNNKKRALYVLAASNDPRAHQILLRYAKGGGNPELQAEAIRYLASGNSKQTTDAELREIYEATQDSNVRRSIIDAYRNTGNKTALLNIVKSKTDKPELKLSAIDGLSNLAAPAELWSLYEIEQDANVKNRMIGVFGSMGALDQLTQIAKTEKDAAVRGQAFRRLGSVRNDKTGQLLVDLYGAEQDREIRKTIISAIHSQNNAEGLVALARKETDLELKREIVRRLSDMAPKNPGAANFLIEMIK